MEIGVLGRKIYFKTAISWLFVSGVVASLDQISKYWVLAKLQLGDTMAFVPQVNITLLFNKGTAFSLLSDGPVWQMAIFLTISGFITLLLLWWMLTVPPKRYLQRSALALLFGGALGNLFDRINFGHVVDFIDFYVGNWHWYVFNVADVAITLGAVLLAMDMLRQNQGEYQ